ncbi:MAG: MFS transporter [Planctomycetota bacterium]
MSISSGSEALSVRGRFTPRRYFAQRVVHPWELPSIMTKHTYTGAMGNIWAVLISDIFFVHFGMQVGLTPFQWGIMGGISSWVIAAQCLSALLTERTGKRKLIWFSFAVGDRALRLAGILVSLWLWRSGWPHAGAVLILAIVISNVLGNMASPPWWSWLADIIPEGEHGSFWGRRAAWIALCVIAVVVPAGLLVDRVSADHKIKVTVGLFVFATVVGILDLVIHGTIPEPKMVVPKRNHFWLRVVEPIRDKAFRPWLTFNMCWTFSMTLGGALATLYVLKDLGIGENFLGGTIVLTSFTLVGSLATGGWSGKLVDRVGVKRVLYWGQIGWALLPGFWLFATPATALWWLGAASLTGGVASTAATTAANKLITRVPPADGRAMYVAVSTSLGSLAGGLGVLAAGIVLRFFGESRISAGWVSLGGFQVLFLASVVLRLLFTLVLVPRIPYAPRDLNGKA